MKTGDTVRDGSGRSWQLGQILGRGLWGKTFSAREEPGGTDWVLKIPLGVDAFSDDAERLARVCREIALEQGRILGQGSSGALLRPEARFTTDAGIPVLVLPRMASTLQAKLQAGVPLEEQIEAAARIAALLRTLPPGLAVHGNLRPVNALTDNKGGWVLSDPATPTLLRHLPALARARGLSLTWLPPEARMAHEQPLADPSIDTHALALALYLGAATPHEGAAPDAPDDGLDKASLVALRDSVRNRLKEEPSNVRFHARLADRLSTLLNRALSREASPSPPYRFGRADELQRRLEEVGALIQPRISHVGRILLDRAPGTEAFSTDEEVSFACSVGCTAGVETHEDIGCGLAVFDLEEDARLRDLPCTYTVDRHPSGRFRFGFRVAGLAPGSYRARIAFTIRDSGDEPTTSEGEFRVHPAAGYVPPPAAPQPKAIAFERKAQDTVVTEVGPLAEPGAPTVEDDSGPVAPVVEVPVRRPLPSAPEPLAMDLPEPVRGPRPIAPGNTSPGFGPSVSAPPSAVASASGPAVPTASTPARPAVMISPPPAQPEYRGAGRWTDLPLPGLQGEGPPPADPFAPDSIDPPRVERAPGALDRLVALAQGDAYKLFIGGAILVIFILALILYALR